MAEFSFVLKILFSKGEEDKERPQPSSAPKLPNWLSWFFCCYASVTESQISCCYDYGQLTRASLPACVSLLALSSSNSLLLLPLVLYSGTHCEIWLCTLLSLSVCQTIRLALKLLQKPESSILTSTADWLADYTSTSTYSPPKLLGPYATAKDRHIPAA